MAAQLLMLPAKCVNHNVHVHGLDISLTKKAQLA